ncbi:DUF3017 domain-containing protein [Brachybacterium sp. GPGPB12]|uniref:DUF3017 domain-containing protein n=1 Tax=Brachybacterium sp. GPGPB12 TaxID=3023517 RepID=UPI0031342454
MRAPRSPHTLRAAFRRQTVLALTLPALALIVLIGATLSAPLAGVLLAALLLVLALMRALRRCGRSARSPSAPAASTSRCLLALALGIAVLSTSPNL